jgi:hypothetical protein
LNYILVKKTEADDDRAASGPFPDEAADQSQNEPEAAAADEDEIAAVIAAVLAAMDEGQRPPVRVMSRAAGETPPVWSMRGRVETMGTR